jgi:hypothetical protein
MTDPSEKAPFSLSPLSWGSLVGNTSMARHSDDSILSMGMGERGARGVEDGVGNGPVVPVLCVARASVSVQTVRACPLAFEPSVSARCPASAMPGQQRLAPCRDLNGQESRQAWKRRRPSTQPNRRPSSHPTAAAHLLHRCPSPSHTSPQPHLSPVIHHTHTHTQPPPQPPSPPPVAPHAVPRIHIPTTSPDCWSPSPVPAGRALI